MIVRVETTNHAYEEHHDAATARAVFAFLVRSALHEQAECGAYDTQDEVDAAAEAAIAEGLLDQGSHARFYLLP